MPKSGVELQSKGTVTKLQTQTRISFFKRIPYSFTPFSMQYLRTASFPLEAAAAQMFAGTVILSASARVVRGEELPIPIESGWHATRRRTADSLPLVHLRE